MGKIKLDSIVFMAIMIIFLLSSIFYMWRVHEVNKIVVNLDQKLDRNYQAILERNNGKP